MPTAAGLYYFAHGADDLTRPPVVLIHGAGGHHLYWPPQVRRLPRQRMFAIDLPGHGKSQGVGSHSIDDYADQVVAFLKALKFSQAVLIGHSMGGAIALQAALDAPRRVIGLGLIGSAARLRVNPALLQAAADPAKGPDVAHMITEYSFSPAAGGRLKATAEQRMLETRLSVLYGDLLACDAFESPDLAGRISVPTLIVFGEQDKMVPLQGGRGLQEQIPGAQLELLPDAGHMVMLEQPDRVAGLLNEFLNEVPYQPGK